MAFAALLQLSGNNIADETWPLMTKSGHGQSRALPQGILGSRPLPGEGFLDSSLEKMIDGMTLGDDDDPNDPSRERFEEILQGIND